MNRGQHQNESPKRVALYARSSQLQPLGEIHAFQAQVDCCTAYCLEHGYVMLHDQCLASVRAGSAESGLPARARLGEAIRQGCVAVVVVSSRDRLARDHAENAILVGEFKDAGVTIVTAGA